MRDVLFSTLSSIITSHAQVTGIRKIKSSQQGRQHACLAQGFIQPHEVKEPAVVLVLFVLHISQKLSLENFFNLQFAMNEYKLLCV